MNVFVNLAEVICGNVMIVMKNLQQTMTNMTCRVVTYVTIADTVEITATVIVAAILLICETAIIIMTVNTAVK
jgi:hypothetical protein